MLLADRSDKEINGKSDVLNLSIKDIDSFLEKHSDAEIVDGADWSYLEWTWIFIESLNNTFNRVR